MKKQVLIAGLSLMVLVLFQSGCERHSASQTVPGYAEKLAEKKKLQQEGATRPLKTNPNPPEFFPGE